MRGSGCEDAQASVDAELLGTLRWRTAEEGIPSAAEYVNSPIDLKCRYARKFTTSWVGYRVHITETREVGLPNIITDVQTAPAPIFDGDATPLIPMKRLRRWNCSPRPSSWTPATWTPSSWQRASKSTWWTTSGPARPDYKWQAREGRGFEAAAFKFDWENEEATCPEGKTRLSWTPAVDKLHNRLMKKKFSGKDCVPCPSRDLCIRSVKE